MITPYSQSKFVEKILTSAGGERFRVLFLVTLVNGEVKAQIVSAKLISSKSPRFHLVGTHKVEPLCLSAYYVKEKHNTEYVPSNAPEVSPYIELYFFNSQPTRAPAF